MLGDGLPGTEGNQLQDVADVAAIYLVEVLASLEMTGGGFFESRTPTKVSTAVRLGAPHPGPTPMTHCGATPAVTRRDAEDDAALHARGRGTPSPFR